MNSDDQHDNSYEDTGLIASVRAHIAYADWRGPDFDHAEALREWGDNDRKRRRENGETNPLVDEWVASQQHPLCGKSSGSATCVLSAAHDGGCFLRTPR